MPTAVRTAATVRSRFSLRSPSLPARLLLLVLAVAAPLAALSALALWRANVSDNARAESALVDQARTMASALDDSFQHAEAALRALAASDALARRDLPVFDRELRTVAAGLPGVIGIALNAPDGHELLNSRWQPGSHPPDERSPNPIAEVFDTGRPFISNLVYVPSLGKFLTGVAIPVFLPGASGSRPAFALGAGLSPERFDALLSTGSLPGRGWFSSIQDRSGTIVARTRNGAKWIGQKGRSEVLAHIARQSWGVVHVRKILDGGAALIAFAHAPLSGYSVQLGIPESVVNASIHNEIWGTLAIAAVLAGVGLLAALIVAGHIIQALRDVARGTGAATGIREIDDMAHDLSAATASLRASETEFRAAFEQAAVGMALVSPDGRFQGVNRRLCAMLGYSEAELLKKSFSDVTHPADLPINHAYVERALRGELSSLSFEKRYLRSDGSPVWANVSSTLVRDAQSVPSRFVSAIQDITERKRAEAALRELTDQLEQRVRSEVAARQNAQSRAAQAERMQALGQLAGGVAHDINNVLQAVQGAAALIERRDREAGEAARFARVIIDAAERGASVTRRLLAFARRSELRTETIDLKALLTGLRPIIAVTLGPEIVLRLSISEEVPAVSADRGQLETVLVNLVTNARDAMIAGGTLTISAMPRVVADDADRPPELTPGSYAQVSVADTGIGMEDATLRRVTEPFFTTKPLGKGTGLGLAMAKGFTEQSGGALVIDSEPDCGTTVHLWLPRAGPGGAPAPTTVVSVAAPPSKPARVLVVDDDRPVLETVAAQLEDSGFAVVTAGGGAEALALIDAGTAVDALVTDLSMPGLNGVDLIRRAQERRPRLPALLLTGYPSDGAAQALCSQTRGMVLLVNKPTPAKKLADRLTALLASVE